MTLEPTVKAVSARDIVSTFEAKLQAKVDGDAEDPLFEIYLGAALDYYESQTSRTVFEKTLEITLDEWPCGNAVKLPRATPLLSILSVTVKDSSGNESVFTDYFADMDSVPGRLVLNYGAAWPSVTLYPANGIRIRYRAGIDDTADLTLPLYKKQLAAVKYPVLLLTDGMYENRESESVTDKASIQAVSMRYGVEAFISKARVEPTCY